MDNFIVKHGWWVARLIIVFNTILGVWHISMDSYFWAVIVLIWVPILIYQVTTYEFLKW